MPNDKTVTASEEEIVMRRFGKDHKMSCNRADVLTCAAWPCQKTNSCQYEESYAKSN